MENKSASIHGCYIPTYIASTHGCYISDIYCLNQMDVTFRHYCLNSWMLHFRHILPQPMVVTFPTLLPQPNGCYIPTYIDVLFFRIPIVLFFRQATVFTMAAKTPKVLNSNSHSHVCGEDDGGSTNTGGVEFQ
jgi:hypothetical protein